MQRSPIRRLGRAVPALIVAIALAGCGSSDRGSRLIVLGLDGMDPQTVDLLMSEGQLPNLARLRQGGAYGRLRSSPPLLSPVIWTTIATGRTPDQHRIGHFTAVDPDTGETIPVTSDMRRVRALWNIFSARRRKVAVVGWWATWPAEAVNGAIVSDHTCYHFLFPEGAGAGSEPAGLTHPPELRERIAPLVRRPADVSLEEALRYVDVSLEEYEQPFSFKNDVSHFRWALATAASYREIGLSLWEESSPDLLMVYVEAPDSTSHLFGHLFRAPELAGELGEQQRRFGSAVEQMYRYADEVIGSYLEAMDDTTTLVVLSDHGFELGVLQDDPSATRDMRRVSERFHRDQGILYLYGNGVRSGARLRDPGLLDVTPTLLALAGLEPALDMPGRVLDEALDFEVPATRVSTYEDGTAAPRAAGGDALSPQVLERLRSLGYVGEPGSAGGPGAGSTPSSPLGDRNIAAVLFQQGRFEESAALYARLVEQSPEEAALYTSLAGALGALGRYDEALEHLEHATRLEPLNVEAYHNRAVILERTGKPEQALAEYRRAVRYDSQYAPSRQALVRLTGSALPDPPRNDAERKAFALADAASEAARRGAYPEAMRLLAAAEELAPELVMVHQHRSNIAYLMGDVAGAIEALETASRLAPDNALFQHNLESLRRAAARSGS